MPVHRFSPSRFPVMLVVIGGLFLWQWWKKKQTSTNYKQKLVCVQFEGRWGAGDDLRERCGRLRDEEGESEKEDVPSNTNKAL